MIKKILLLHSIIFASSIFAQTNCELLKNENTSLKIENQNLKEVLEINKSITETEKDNSFYRITRVIGKKTEKTISITMLIESKDENKQVYTESLSIIDLEGNEYEIDPFKSTNINPKLSLNVPHKVMVTFKNIENEASYIKILRFGVKNELERNPYESTTSRLEFRDLKVSWQ